MTINAQEKEIYKCGILHDLLIGNYPDPLDYVNENGLSYRQFINLIAAMQKEGLIQGVVFQDSDPNTPPLCVLEKAEVTDKGIDYLEKFMEELN